MPNNNKALSRAAKIRNDEFYTQYVDIEKELVHYIPYLENKIIYCNTDNNESNFYQFFKDHFNDYKLKKLICTSLDGFSIELTKENEIKQNNGGNFSSDNCIKYLEECDIVITNPPFSIIRDFIDLLLKYNKQFLFLSNINVAGYKTILPLFVENKIWCGYNEGKHIFTLPDGTEKVLNNICWMTNLPVKKDFYIPICEKNIEEYEVFDTRPDIINVNRYKEIPKNYKGPMGVPVSFISKMSNEQYKILGQMHGSYNPDFYLLGKALVRNKEIYTRLVIQEKEKE